MIGKRLSYYRYICFNTALSTTIWLFPAAAVLVFSLCLLAMAWGPEASAASLIVTKLADTDDGTCDGDCSLREALTVATPDGMIEFARGLKGTITLGSTLSIVRNVTINGPDTKPIMISGNDAVRVFYVNPGVHFILRNLIVTKGYTIGMQGANGAQIEGKAGGPAMGGGLYNDKGVVEIINSTFSTNRAIGGSGGWAGGWAGNYIVKPGIGGTAFGGAIFSSGNIVFMDSTFAENQAIGGNPGAVDVHHKSLLSGPGGNGMGGALYLTVEGVISNCTFYKNSAIGAAGKDYWGRGGDGVGGALYAIAAVKLINSTFSRNRAKGGTGGMIEATRYGYTDPRAPLAYAGDGGNGQGGASFFVADAWISNCTYYGNAAQVGSPGGTIRGKSQAVGSGGAIFRPAAIPRGKTLDANKSSPIIITNTILSNSSSGGNCEASLISEGYNIDSDGSCSLTAPGDLSKIDPKLEPLKQNGGSTSTHALLPSSPAIDGGNPAGCTDHNGVLISTDQRGHSRMGRCDIGAFEFHANN